MRKEEKEGQEKEQEKETEMKQRKIKRVERGRGMEVIERRNDCEGDGMTEQRRRKTSFGWTLSNRGEGREEEEKE